MRKRFKVSPELKIPQRDSREHPENKEAQGPIFFPLMAEKTVWRFFVTGSLQGAYQASSEPYQA